MVKIEKFTSASEHMHVVCDHRTRWKNAYLFRCNYVIYIYLPTRWHYIYVDTMEYVVHFSPK